MSQILDLVPNHMGVMGADNRWWLDVLENGQSSVYAEFFDIDWEPPDPTRRGKLLVPVLGAHYGQVLERGELKLAFDQATGSFSFYYYEHRFPLDPRDYPIVLERARQSLASALDDGALARVREPDHRLRPPAGARASETRLGSKSAAATRNCTSNAWRGCATPILRYRWPSNQR